MNVVCFVPVVVGILGSVAGLVGLGVVRVLMREVLMAVVRFVVVLVGILWVVLGLVGAGVVALVDVL